MNTDSSQPNIDPESDTVTGASARDEVPTPASLPVPPPPAALYATEPPERPKTKSRGCLIGAGIGVAGLILAAWAFAILVVANSMNSDGPLIGGLPRLPGMSTSSEDAFSYSYGESKGIHVRRDIRSHLRGRIAFSSERDGHREIYTVDVDGGGLYRVTNDHAEASGPAWSPDGKRLAYTLSRAEDKAGERDIFVVNADGTGSQRITSHAGYNAMPAWSPDGSKIAFQSDRSGTYDIYVMNADGSHQERLNTESSEESNPAWSPDGKYIVYDSAYPGNTQIYKMRADGTERKRLTQNSTNDWQPVWSPDGNWIAFTSNRNKDHQIFVMKPDGTGQRRLSDGYDDEDPAWSPDSNYVAFMSKDDDEDDPWSAVYVTDIYGSEPAHIVSNSTVDSDPAWTSK